MTGVSGAGTRAEMVYLAKLAPERSMPERFRRGDSNADGNMNLSDPIYLLTWLFLAGPEPSCLDSADAND